MEIVRKFDESSKNVSWEFIATQKFATEAANASDLLFKQPWNLKEIVGISVAAILVPFILGSNFLVIASVYKFRRLQVPTNYFMVSLAVADMFIALCIPFSTTVELYRFDIHNVYLCLAPNRVLMSACGASILTLATIAYDRYQALEKPLEYITIMTAKKISILIGFSWTYSAFISWIPLLAKWHIDIESRQCSFSLLHQHAHILLLAAVFAPACLAIFICYFRIYVIARHHARAIAAVENSLHYNLHMQYIMKDTKYAKTLAIVIGTFLSLWLPFQICLLTEMLTGVVVDDWVRNYVAYVAFLNSGLNPWVYAYKNYEFRAAFKRLFKEWCGQCCDKNNRRQSVTSNSSDSNTSLSRLSFANGNITQADILHIMYKDTTSGKTCSLESLKNLNRMSSRVAMAQLLQNYLKPDKSVLHTNPQTSMNEINEIKDQMR